MSLQHFSDPHLMKVENQKHGMKALTSMLALEVWAAEAHHGVHCGENDPNAERCCRTMQKVKMIVLLVQD